MMNELCGTAPYMALEIILGYTSSLDLVSLQYLTVVAFSLTYTGGIESCTERRTRDPGEQFVHEFDLIQILYRFASILWCASPSHRYFCTKIMTPADVAQILIPFTKTLQMRLGERLQDQFSICQNMREI